MNKHWHGACAICSTQDLLSPIKATVSRNFASFDGWRRASGGVCPACTWAIKNPQLRALSHLVTADPQSVSTLPPDQLHAFLLEPCPPGRAVIVPIRPGRTHLFLNAAWGHVTTDDGPLTWTKDDAGLYQRAHQLTHSGISPHALPLAAPPYNALGRLTAAQVADVLTVWPALDAWRRHRQPWMRLAVKSLTCLRRK